MLRPDAIVVGAGVAGLAAALELQRDGRSVLVLEAGSRVGGLAWTEQREGFLVDRGPVSLAQPSPEVVVLLELAGIWHRRIKPAPVARTRWIVRGGRLVRMPAGPRQLLRSPILSVAGKLRLAGELLVRPGPAHDESFMRFAERRFGREVFEHLADPFQQGIFAGDPARLSMAHAFPRLRQAEQEHGSLLRAAFGGMQKAPTTWSFPAGIGQLPELLAAALRSPVRTGARVESAAPAQGGWALRLDDGTSFSAPELVLAVPPRQLGLLKVGAQHARSLQHLATLPMASLATVALGYPRRNVTHPLDGFGALIPHCEGRAALGIIFASSTFPVRAPADHVLLTVLLGGVRQGALAALSEDALTALATREVGELLGARGAPVLSMVSRWPDAIPQLELDHATRLAAAREIEESVENLAFAGAWRGGIGLAGALEGGLRAARQLEGVLIA